MAIRPTPRQTFFSTLASAVQSIPAGIRESVRFEQQKVEEAQRRQLSLQRLENEEERLGIARQAAARAGRKETVAEKKLAKAESRTAQLQNLADAVSSPIPAGLSPQEGRDVKVTLSRQGFEATGGKEGFGFFEKPDFTKFSSVVSVQNALLGGRLTFTEAENLITNIQANKQKDIEKVTKAGTPAQIARELLRKQTGIFQQVDALGLFEGSITNLAELIAGNDLLLSRTDTTDAPGLFTGDIITPDPDSTIFELTQQAIRLEQEASQAILGQTAVPSNGPNEATKEVIDDLDKSKTYRAADILSIDPTVDIEFLKSQGFNIIE